MKEVQKLLDITSSLRQQFEGKLNFSLDGKLVGDIGEALVSEMFNIELFGKNNPDYDGEQRKTKKRVQIKSSMKYNFSYPFDKILDYYIAAHIKPDGTPEIIYNGPGKYIHAFLIERKRKSYRNIWYTISVNHLKMLDSKIKPSERLQQV